MSGGNMIDHMERERGSAVWAGAVSAAMGDGIVRRTPTAPVITHAARHPHWWDKLRGRR